jgi:hypothetical protein
VATDLATRALNMGERMITKYGKRTTACYLRRKSGADYPVKIAVMDFRLQDIDGNLIRRNDKRVLMSAKNLSITPDMETDQLVIGAEVYQIKNIITIQPGDLVVLYDLQVRR